MGGVRRAQEIIVGVTVPLPLIEVLRHKPELAAEIVVDFDLVIALGIDRRRQVHVIQEPRSVIRRRREGVQQCEGVSVERAGARDVIVEVRETSGRVGKLLARRIADTGGKSGGAPGRKIPSAHSGSRIAPRTVDAVCWAPHCWLQKKNVLCLFVL